MNLPSSKTQSFHSRLTVEPGGWGAFEEEQSVYFWSSQSLKFDLIVHWSLFGFQTVLHPGQFCWDFMLMLVSNIPFTSSLTSLSMWDALCPSGCERILLEAPQLSPALFSQFICQASTISAQNWTLASRQIVFPGPVYVSLRCLVDTGSRTTFPMTESCIYIYVFSLCDICFTYSVYKIHANPPLVMYILRGTSERSILMPASWWFLFWGRTPRRRLWCMGTCTV